MWHVRLLSRSSFVLDEGCRCAGLASALRVNAVLKTLYLTANEIGDEGAVAIADALRVNEVPTKLNLCFNDGQGDEGKRVIRDAP
ncbi:hypothetical protein EMIHUDRAFT_259668 [Emiliania huxleyi CCMP1516]|uniref:Uncharacterized protein n=2 Tax=Emiliania huxleyi TaxID=2903 RepID=A0A0D3HZ54_EMIH1|nr:hypothetical protein EMIHUDRAFT_259668 [Emiliania huxleyi CCMP1516]EOD04289.1 hypothetical protein EMIHUDRAFT_259668 [Emiliania huxleyi CCMP1516]|eukprot:XP_005756718.1 hypothetical protein EMIHUDRAFT_259668 [Emiliania huxleyi CCMP1516]